MGKSYFKQNLRYTQDVLVDENNLNVMMEWERPIMKQAAFDICKNGGDILNVGFGMGIIDSYIQEYPIKSHTIIEGHPDIQKKIIADGWAKKPNVILIFDQWQNVIDNLPKYDGIYFDTWADNQIPFDEKVPNILKPNGIYSFFNSPTNAGEEWVAKYIVDTYHIFNSIFFINNNLGWALEEYNSLVLKTTDGGENWIEYSISMGYPRSIYFINEDVEKQLKPIMKIPLKMFVFKILINKKYLIYIVIFNFQI